MGQAKHKNRFFKVAEQLFAQLGSETSGLSGPGRDAVVLELCRLTQSRWFDLEDGELHTLYRRALLSSNTQVSRGLSLFLDGLLGRIWPSSDSVDPELDLFLAVPCQVLPFLGDIIGDFDDVSDLAQSLSRELQVAHGLQGFTLHMDCGLFDVDPFEGWPSVVQAAYVAKNPSLRVTHGVRQCFRFSDTPAVAPVTRTVWARLSFQTAEQLRHALHALAAPRELMATQASLNYTVNSVTQAGAQQLTAGVRALAIGPAFETLVQWAFQEGRLEVAAACRDVCQLHGLQAQELKAMVVVVEQPSIALPEGVLGSAQMAATVGKSDPQVQVLFARAGSDTPATQALGRALFTRANAQTLQVAVKQTVTFLGGLGMALVELGKVASPLTAPGVTGASGAPGSPGQA